MLRGFGKAQRIETYLERVLGAEVLERRQRVRAVFVADLQDTQRSNYVMGRYSESTRSTGLC